MDQIFPIVRRQRKDIEILSICIDIQQAAVETNKHKGSEIISQKSHLVDFSNGALTKLYNYCNADGKSIKKFNTLEDGINRLWKFLNPTQSNVAKEKGDNMKAKKKAVPFKAAKKVVTEKKSVTKKSVTKKSVAKKSVAKKQSCSSMVKEAINSGKSDVVITSMIKKNFPDANTPPIVTINFYKNKLGKI